MLYALIAVICLVLGLAGGFFFTRYVYDELYKTQKALLDRLRAEQGISVGSGKPAEIGIMEIGEK